MIDLHFVYSYGQPGRYLVFTRNIVHLGTVRRSADPIRKAEAWGYESTPFGCHPRGVTCDGGFRTRRDAAVALAARFLGVDKTEISFE